MILDGRSARSASWTSPACLSSALLLLLALPANAHEASKAKSRFTVGEDGRVAVSVGMRLEDFAQLMGVADAEARALTALTPALVAQVPQSLGDWLEVATDQGPCPLSVGAWAPESNGLRVSGEARCPAGEQSLAIRWKAGSSTRLRMSTTVEILGPDGTRHTLSLDGTIPLARVHLPKPDRLGSLGAFAVSGAKHILIGWDHLAFLLALVLACSTWRRLLLVVSTFTLAHSLTLGLGATGVITIGAQIVEPVIAASIAVAAVLALIRLRRDQLDHPGRSGPRPSLLPEVVLTLLFGLVHGLGFASMLRAQLSEGASVLLPLLGFNLGVEAGQLACVALAFPVLVGIGRQRWARPAFACLLVALVIIGCGVTFERVFA